EEYIKCDIVDNGGISDDVWFVDFPEVVDSSAYFINKRYMETQTDGFISEIMNLQRGAIQIEVSEETPEITEDEYIEDTKNVDIPNFNPDIDFRTMSAEEAEGWINYVYSYGEYFSMNELGYQAGELRGYCDEDIIMYTWENTGDTIYFIPASMTNTTITSDSGEKYWVYVNKDGYMEFYYLERNRYADDRQLRTSLFMKSAIGTEYINSFITIGEGKLQLLESELLDVPKVIEDEYVLALEKYIANMLKQEGKSGRYEIYVGEYEALANSKVCLSAACLGEKEDYYFRYMIVKNGEENYYFWPVGFGLDGSLEECAGDRHYMNKVCIERTKQLERSKFVLDITQSLPETVWEEKITYEEQIYLAAFERISPAFQTLSDLYGGYADYQLVVKDENGNVVSSQILTNFPITLEEVYWFKDISGDDFPDIILCSSYVEGNGNRFTNLIFLIWNNEKLIYESKPLPWDKSLGSPVWNEELSSIIFAYIDDEVNMEMFTYKDGEWSLSGKCAVESEKEKENGNIEFVCGEYFYKDNQTIKNEIKVTVPEQNLPWHDDNSIWGGTHNVQNEWLFPSYAGWKTTDKELEGGRTVWKYIRADAGNMEEETAGYNESQDSVSLLKLEELLENNLFENVSFQQSENAIAFYETNVHTPFEGYQIPVYRETSEKDILFEGTFLVEKDTGDIYIRGEKEWVLLKEGILKGLVLPDEPEDVFVHEYDGDNEVVVELLDKVFDFLKTKKEYANFKIKYDGAYSFLGRKYHSVSLIEDINDDMIHTLQRYSVDMETGDLYQESDPEERKELYYMGNLGIEQEAAEAGTEDIEYVNEVIPVQYTDDLSFLEDMKYTNSTYVYQDGKVYYRRYHEDSYEEAVLWGEYDAIPGTKKEMVCVDADGIETVLFTDEGYGDIYLLNNRFYLTTAERKESAYGYTYTSRCLYSVNMQGKERIDYGEGYVFAIDKERKIIIMQLREESGICYYAVNYETGEKERLCFRYPFDSGAYQDGWFYYERHIGDDITCKLCAVSLEGEEREIIALISDGNQVPNVIEHISDIKVDENRIYFIFGGCDGSLQVFQGGKLISIKLDGTDYRAVETERDAFYLSHDKGKPMVYFVSHYNAPIKENYTMVWDVEENICYRSDFPADDLNYYEKSIYKDGSIYKNVERMWRYYPATMGSLYSVTRYDSDLQRQKEDIYAIPDDSGRIVRVVTDIEQYITKWEEEEASYIDYEDFYFADGYLYFKVEYSVYDEGTSIGWRDGIRRLHVDFYRLKIGESKAEILYSYI
ncbi:MAG: hypothetical protein K2H31_07035, partial [Lachnospiraceae bacterium]|nr:hypothetical protein [Lachnospiraceae bacterium]